MTIWVCTGTSGSPVEYDRIYECVRTLGDARMLYVYLLLTIFDDYLAELVMARLRGPDRAGPISNLLQGEPGRAGPCRDFGKFYGPDRAGPGKCKNLMGWVRSGP